MVNFRGPQAVEDQQLNRNEEGITLQKQKNKNRGTGH
jgi:hypothetical protein